jgi:hypothetical protein
LQVKPSTRVLTINTIYIINYREQHRERRRDLLKTYLEEVKKLFKPWKARGGHRYGNV